VHHELEVFRPHRYWAPRAFFQMILRVSSNEAKDAAAAAERPAQGEDAAVVAMKPPKPRGRPKRVKALVPVGEPTIAAPPVIITPPVVAIQPAVAAQPAPAEEHAAEEPIAATQSVPKAPQIDDGDDDDDDDDGEVIDIHIPDDDLDTTIATTILGLSHMSVDPKSGFLSADNDKGNVLNTWVYAALTLVSR
jgi:hypothetical protein